MKKCEIHLTGMKLVWEGSIQDGYVYHKNVLGEWVLPNENHTLVFDFEISHHLAQIKVDEKWGYANNLTGKIVLEPQWDYAGTFYMYAKVPLQSKSGYIDKNGEIVIPLIYDDVDDMPDTIVGKQNRIGVIDWNNVNVIPFIYRSISRIKKNFYITTHWNSEKELLIERMRNGEDVLAELKKIEWLQDIWINGEKVITGINEFISYHPALKTLKKREYWRFMYHRELEYYILRRKRKYGILREDGTLLTEISLKLKEAKIVIDKLIEPK